MATLWITLWSSDQIYYRYLHYLYLPWFSFSHIWGPFAKNVDLSYNRPILPQIHRLISWIIRPWSCFDTADEWRIDQFFHLHLFARTWDQWCQQGHDRNLTRNGFGRTCLSSRGRCHQSSWSQNKDQSNHDTDANKEVGVTQLDHSLEITDLVVVLKEGEIVETGTYADLFANKASEVCHLLTDLLWAMAYIW